MAFYGKYSHGLDAKNRLFIPAKYRPELGDVFYIVPSCVDSHLMIYTQNRWDRLIADLNAHPDAKVEKLRRFFFSKSIDVSCDTHGRIILSPELIEYAKIKKGAIISGMGDYAEIWSEELWKEKVETVDLDELRDIYAEL